MTGKEVRPDTGHETEEGQDDQQDALRGGFHTPYDGAGTANVMSVRHITRGGAESGPGKVSTDPCVETGRTGAAEERAGIATARIATASAIRSNIAAIHATMADAMLEPPSRRSAARDLVGGGDGSIGLSGSIGVQPLVSIFMTEPFLLPDSRFAVGATYLDSAAVELVMVTSGTFASVRGGGENRCLRPAPPSGDASPAPFVTDRGCTSSLRQGSVVAVRETPMRPARVWHAEEN